MNVCSPYDPFEYLRFSHNVKYHYDDIWKLVRLTMEHYTSDASVLSVTELLERFVNSEHIGKFIEDKRNLKDTEFAEFINNYYLFNDYVGFNALMQTRYAMIPAAVPVTYTKLGKYLTNNTEVNTLIFSSIYAGLVAAYDTALDHSEWNIAEIASSMAFATFRKIWLTIVTNDFKFSYTRQLFYDLLNYVATAFEFYFDDSLAADTTQALARFTHLYHASRYDRPPAHASLRVMYLCAFRCGTEYDMLLRMNYLTLMQEQLAREAIGGKK